MKDSTLKFDLCLFGDAPDENDPAGAVKTYTQEEFDKRLQSESDKRVTEALKTQEERLQKEFEKKLEEGKSEAEKMAAMSAEERAREEFEKEREAFNKDREAFERDKLELEVRKELGMQGLDEDFAPFLMQEDAQTSFKQIQTFKASFDAAVEAAVKEQLKGSAPKSGGADPVPKDAFQLLNEKYQ